MPYQSEYISPAYCSCSACRILCRVWFRLRTDNSASNILYVDGFFSLFCRFVLMLIFCEPSSGSFFLQS